MGGLSPIKKNLQNSPHLLRLVFDFSLTQSVSPKKDPLMLDCGLASSLTHWTPSCEVSHLLDPSDDLCSGPTKLVNFTWSGNFRFFTSEKDELLGFVAEG